MNHTNIEIIDVGNVIVCDSCNVDFTKRDDCGGFLFGTSAYCPECVVRLLPKIQEYGEESFIKAVCPTGMKFRDWVLQLRGGNNLVKFIYRRS